MPSRDADRTLMIYMAGFNDLSEFAKASLARIQRIGSTDQVKVTVFIKSKGPKGAPECRRLVVGKSGQQGQSQLLQNVDSGRVGALIDFIQWSKEVAPARRYALIIWNHGGGWSPDQLDQLYAEAVKPGSGIPVMDHQAPVSPHKPWPRPQNEARTVRPIPVWPTSLDRVLFRESMLGLLRSTSRLPSALAFDEDTGHSLDTLELHNVLAAARDEKGDPLVELLGMDACLMSSLEVAYECANDVHFMVASQDVEFGGYGWPYFPILKRLAGEPTMEGARLGACIVDEYISGASSKPAIGRATLSALDNSKIDSVAGLVNDLGEVLQAQLHDAAALQKVHSALKDCSHFLGHVVDLRSFCDQLAKTMGPGAPAVLAAHAVIDAIEKGDAIISNRTLGSGWEQCGGVNIYLPEPPHPVSQFYANLRFAKDHPDWLGFLRKYQSVWRPG